jgi:hypothetical protein
MSKVDIKKLFYGLQRQMCEQLNTNRANILHPTSKGDSFELKWIEWLREYLPKRYKVDKAFVIDHTGNLSEQIDLVIYDRQYSPFVFRQDGTTFIPAESVYAVFEVKPEINKKYLDYAIKKIQSVRVLERTSAHIFDFKGRNEPKPLPTILGGILGIKITFKPPYEQYLENYVKKLKEAERLNFGCAIEDAGFIVDYEIPSKSTVLVSDKNEALIFFFLKLLESLQKMATVPAIDITKYAKALNSI